jgi:hypothetical protein
MKYLFYTGDEYQDGWECDFVKEVSHPLYIDVYVREFCDYLYSERDGWEWMKNSTETIVVVDEEGTVRRYSFELEYEPSFYVTELKEG